MRSPLLYWIRHNRSLQPHKKEGTIKMKKFACAAILGLLFHLGGMLYQTHASRIAYICEEGFDICTINPDGTDRQRVTRTLDITERWPTWSPEGTRIAIWVAGDPSGIGVMRVQRTGIKGYSERHSPILAALRCCVSGADGKITIDLGIVEVEIVLPAILPESINGN